MSNTNKNEQTDPEGLPIDRKMKSQDEVQPTSPGITVTSPNSLSGKPASYLVGSEAPGHSTAPESKVEGTRSSSQSGVQEYKAPVSRLPDSISARDVYNDRTNADGCTASEVQR
jgi:hypothetical protein